MRKAINDNPMVQIGVLVVLALLVGFVLITRMSHKSSESSADSSTAATSSASTAGTATPTESSAMPSSSSGTAPDATAVAPTTPPAAGAGAVAGATTGDFTAGPGLPAALVQAYKADRVVVLLVVRRNGIDDEAVKSSVENMAGGENVALFVTNAGHIARYSRIAAGVNLDRVPALIVLRPRSLADGTPTAMVSYGFRSPESVAQAIHDATYKGPTNQPYYPK